MNRAWASRHPFGRLAASKQVLHISVRRRNRLAWPAAGAVAPTAMFAVPAPELPARPQSRDGGRKSIGNPLAPDRLCREEIKAVAPIHAAGGSDLVLRNVNTGAFKVYDIANNQLTGAAALRSWRACLRQF